MSETLTAGRPVGGPRPARGLSVTVSGARPGLAPVRRIITILGLWPVFQY